MSVEKMTLVTLTGHTESLNDALRLCLTGGNFQPETASDHLASLKHYARLNEENPYQQLADRLAAARSAAGEEAPPAPYAGDFTLEECRAAIDGLEHALADKRSELDTLQQEVAYCRACMIQLEHFQTMDVPLQDLFDCAFTAVRFGRLPVTSRAAVDRYCEKNGNVLFVPFSTDEQFCWGMYLAPKEAIDEVDVTFAVLFFERLHVPDAVATPADAMRQLTQQLEPDEQRVAELQRELAEALSPADRLYDRMYAFLLRQAQLCDMRKYAAVYDDHFILVGWVPAAALKGLSEQIAALPDVELTETDSDHVKNMSPPIRLKNRLFAKPFEFYTKMFGMPTYGELDPTAFVAITYTLLYGIMFADIGQGLVLALVGYVFMYKMKGMALGRLLLPCGLSGAFFGLVFGSVFGYEHALDPLYHALGFAEKPIEIMSSSNIMTILLVAVGIGVVLMLCALGLNIYSCLRQKKWGAAFFGENGVTGFVLYLSAIVLVLGMVTGTPLPTGLLAGLGIGLPAVILWLKEPLQNLADGKKDWQPEGWGSYLTQGFFELFEALLSYVTNTVSFLRVGAFVLVHASMMMVFMTLADMAGPAGVIIAVFGNVFVLALEGLLVGVQSLRLEFYEMFNRFFEGAGREFEPLTLSH